MPDSSPRGKAEIRRIVEALPHATMLDIGCGSGTYAKMFPEACWTGVEAWEPYVEQFGLNDLYKTLIVGDARTTLPAGHFDVAICGDVLEHMAPAEAKALIENLLGRADVVIASIPIGHWPQDEVNGNPFERHVKDDWTHEDVCKLIGDPVYICQDGEIGVYVWSNKYGAETFVPKRLKIAVYAISKNEEQFVKRFCDSAKDADLILIADTGSTDDTVNIAKECGAEVHDIQIRPWRFDKARNAALAKLPADVDVAVSLDLDETLVEGWREAIEHAWIPGSTRLRYGFDWGMGIVFQYEKIHARHGYHWHHPVHEYPRPNDVSKEVWAQTDKLLVVHKPDSTKSRGQYLPLLELAVQEDPECPHENFYLAREYTFHERWQDAIDQGRRYLALPTAVNVNERCYAMRTLAKAYASLGNWWAAEAHLLQAAAEAMGTREPFFELAEMYYRQSRWVDCYAAALRCLAIERRDWVYTCNPDSWGPWPAGYASIAAWHLGWQKEAEGYAQRAIDLAPDELQFRRNLEEILKNPKAA